MDPSSEDDDDDDRMKVPSHWCKAQPVNSSTIWRLAVVEEQER